MDPLLKLAYDNFQNWIRHYQSLSVNINVFALTAYAAVLGLTVQRLREIGSGLSILDLLPLVFPFMLSIAAILVTWRLSAMVRQTFAWLVRIERALGMYQPHAGLPDGEALLDNRLPAEGQETQPMFRLFLAMHALAIGSTVMVIIIAMNRNLFV